MEKNNNIVFTNGCFDILHVGHISLLKFCHNLAGAGQIVLAVDSDKKIKQDKGDTRPIFSYWERVTSLTNLLFLLGIGCTMFMFDTDQELYDLIKRTNPDYIVKGPDWTNKEIIGSDLAKVVFSHRFEQISTTEIIDKIKEKIK